MEHGKKVFTGGRSAGRVPVRSYDIYGTVAAVFAFQQRTDERTIRGRGPGVDVGRTSTKVTSAAAVVIMVLLLLLRLLMVIVRMVRKLQAGVAPVQRVWVRPLLSRRRQTGVGPGSQHVAVVIVHRLGRMLTRRTSGGGGAVPRASF